MLSRSGVKGSDWDRRWWQWRGGQMAWEGPGVRVLVGRAWVNWVPWGLL